MNKRKVILIGIFGLLVICLYVSISYSYYLIGNDKVEIETAMESPSCVGISIDSGEAFSLNGDYAVPITNAQFLNSKPETQDIYKYSFTITNSCEGQDLNGLTIGLVPLDGSNLPISNLKYILIKSDENDNSFVENDIKEFTDDSVKKLPKGMMQQLSNSYKESATNVYPVGSTSLSGKNPVSYDLYVWIDSSAGNETMDETFKAAVVLYKEETILDVLLKSDPGDGELIHHDGSVTIFDSSDYENTFTPTDSCFGVKYDKVSDIVVSYYGDYYLKYDFTQEELTKIENEEFDSELSEKFDNHVGTIDYILERAVSEGCLKYTSQKYVVLDAQDDGYRYAGNQPNNYICFGKGSEAYNRGDVGATCDIKNKYRIIGYVPVTLEDGSSEFRVKVIKAEYLTEDEFGTKASTANRSSTYESLKRIESSQRGIPSYKWNDTSNNNWKESTLYMSLNSDESNGYKDKAFGDTWLNKIETVKWNLGGVSDNELTARAMYEEEMTGQGATATVDAQIGLMYAHDYGFASSSDNWQTEICYYNKNENRNNNWLFNGVEEWTISSYSSVTYVALYVCSAGYVHDYNPVYSPAVAVRPVFYLKSNVKIVGGEGADGSQASPLKVE